MKYNLEGTTSCGKVHRWPKRGHGDLAAAVTHPIGICESRIPEEAVYPSQTLTQHVNSIYESRDCSKSGDSDCSKDGARARVGFPAQEQCGISNQTRLWCLWLGMTPRAWDKWGKLHLNPFVAVCHFFSTDAGLLFTCTGLLVGMANFRPLYLYVIALPLLLYLAFGMFMLLLIWRHGLDVIENKLYHGAVAVSGVLMLPTVIMGDVGPIDAVPFHNRLYYLCWNSCALFCVSQVMAAGGSVGEHPAQPRTSILRPFLRGTRRAVQLVDAFTDLAVIKTLLEQKASDCWWFGEQGNCQAWTWLTAVLSVFSGMKCFLSVSMLVSGSESSGQSQRLQRLVFAAEVVAMVCELGVACCILLEIFSLQASADQLGVDESKLESQIALGIGSLIATCAALVIKFLGAAAALRAMCSVWHKVRLSFSPSRRGESFKQQIIGGAEVVPVHPEADEDDELMVPYAAMKSSTNLTPW